MHVLAKHTILRIASSGKVRLLSNTTYSHVIGTMHADCFHENKERKTFVDSELL